MHKISEIQLNIRHRNGYPAPMNFVDILVDGRSLLETYALKCDFVSCLGWGSQEFQIQQISRLLLNSEPDDIDSRYSLFICPACADLGCGAISLNIEKTEFYIKWFAFGYRDIPLEEQFVFYFDQKDYFEKIQATYGMCGFSFPWEKKNNSK